MPVQMLVQMPVRMPTLPVQMLVLMPVQMPPILIISTSLNVFVKMIR